MPCYPPQAVASGWGVWAVAGKVWSLCMHMHVCLLHGSWSDVCVCARITLYIANVPILPNIATITTTLCIPQIIVQHKITIRFSDAAIVCTCRLTLSSACCQVHDPLSQLACLLVFSVTTPRSSSRYMGHCGAARI